MKERVNLYRIANALSLDVVAGAVISALLFARLLNVRAGVWEYVTLGIGVWIIYTADHLMDAWRLKSPASTYRHRFHQSHSRELFRALVVALVLEGVAVCLIPVSVLLGGVVLGGLVAVYLWQQKHLTPVKELVIAILYCAGIILPSWLGHTGPVPANIWRSLVQFGLVVLTNLVLFSLFDQQADRNDRQHSLATLAGAGRTRVLLACIFCVSGIAFVIGLQKAPDDLEVNLVLLTMNMLLFLPYAFSNQFEEGELYRLIGDSVFFLPLFYLLR